MQKLGLIIVASGALIGIGLVLLALGNQVILEDVNQGDGKIVLIRMLQFLQILIQKKQKQVFLLFK